MGKGKKKSKESSSGPPSSSKVLRTGGEIDGMFIHTCLCVCVCVCVVCMNSGEWKREGGGDNVCLLVLLLLTKK